MNQSKHRGNRFKSSSLQEPIPAYDSYSSSLSSNTSSSLSNDVVVRLQIELESERTRCTALLNERNALSAEVEELTSRLFQEANEMVASEVRARSDLESQVVKLHVELLRIQDELDFERAQLTELRSRLQQIDNKHDQKPNSNTDVYDLILQNADTLDSSNLKYEKRLLETALDSLDPRIVSSFKAFLEYRGPLDIAKTPYFLGLLKEDIMPCFPVNASKSFAPKIITSMLANRFTMEQCKLSKMPSCTNLGENAEKLESSPIDLAKSRSLPGSPVKKSTARQHFHNLMSNLTFSVTSLPDESGIVEDTLNAASMAPDNQCALCKARFHSAKSESLRYRFQLEERPLTTQLPSSTGSVATPTPHIAWFIICIWCRKRLVAIGDLVAFVRNLKRLSIRDTTSALIECFRLRKKCAEARITGFGSTFFNLDNGLCWSHVFNFPTSVD